MEIVPLGDSAVIVRLRDDFHAAPEKALREVTEAQRRLEAAAIPGVIECAPAYASVGVFFDPTQIIDRMAGRGEVMDWLTSEIVSALARPLEETSPTAGRAVLHEIPICYDAECAPDLEEVSRCAKLTVDEVIKRHHTAEYRVHCIGFMPGFPYLGGLPAELATPRRTSPRTEVAAGSVAIGGAHAGIYPTASPGGWNIIGRTTLRLFDAERAQPALLGAGDHVQFRPITRDEFHALTTGRDPR